MENKINIAELLKDCPKGMELDCTMFENVTFVRVDMSRKQFPIEIAVGGIRSKYLTKEGCFHDTTLLPESKCVIFPKGKTTWEGFKRPFEDGDILATNDGKFIAIVKKNGGKFYCCCHTTNGTYFVIDESGWFDRLATEEEKEKLFQAIKDNGYKWNPYTKTLEKLTEPKFKVGDRVRHKTTNKDDVYEISKIYDDSYGLVGYNWMLYMKYQDQYELVPNKFDITTLVPFESRVLVRHGRDNKWCGSFFSHIDEVFHSHCYKFVTTAGKSYPMCIPYEGNKHLLGTTNDCDKYYKTWE